MRLKGFTLIEIIITLIISGILLALAIKVILTIMSMGKLQNKTTTQNDNLITVYTAIKQNFQNSQSIETNEDKDLIFNYPDKKSTIVSFKPSAMIISDYLISDTIPVTCEKLRIVTTDSPESFVNRISFIIHCNNLEYPILFKKLYTNQALYNMKRHAD